MNNEQNTSNTNRVDLPSPCFTSGEIGRTFEQLWKAHDKFDGKLDEVRQEIAQIPHMLEILKRIDLAQISQAPVCSARGVRIENLEKKIEVVEEIETRISDLEASNRILKWILGVVTTLLTGIGAEKLLRIFS